MLLPVHVPPQTTLEAHAYFKDLETDQQVIAEVRNDRPSPSEKELQFMDAWIEDQLDLFFGKFPNILADVPVVTLT